MNSLERRYRETQSQSMREEYEEYLGEYPCPDCGGKRLKKEALAVTVGGKSIYDATTLPVDDALASETPAAIIARRPCLLIKREHHDIGLCRVDTNKCIGCKKCLKVGCPAVMMKDGRSFIDPTQCVGCTVCAQVCPVGAITRKEL